MPSRSRRAPGECASSLSPNSYSVRSVRLSLTTSYSFAWSSRGASGARLNAHAAVVEQSERALRVWQILIAEAVGYGCWIAWKAWFSAAQQLTNQASHMGWRAVGTVKDENGYRDTLLQRDDVVARVSFQQKCVFIVEPEESGPYKDFVEIERALAAA